MEGANETQIGGCKTYLINLLQLWMGKARGYDARALRERGSIVYGCHSVVHQSQSRSSTLVEGYRAHRDYETRRKRAAMNVDNDRRGEGRWRLGGSESGKVA